MMTASAPHSDIPRLIAQLRAHIVLKTGKPIDADVDALTNQIEMLSATQATINSDDYDLTPAERRMFSHLSTNPGRYFEREALMNALYFDRHPAKETPAAKIVDVFATRLRKKLVGTEHFIEGRRGHGFRLVPRDGQNDDVERTAEWRGVLMGRKQANLLARLFADLGKAVSWNELMMPGDSYPDITSRVRYARRHLGTRETETFEIVTINGFGYKMVRT